MKTSKISKLTYQRQIPVFITSLIAGLLLVEYFVIPIPALTAVRKEILSWGVVIASLILMYSGVTLVLMNVRRVVERKAIHRYMVGSYIFLCSYVVCMAVGFSTPLWTGGAMFGWIVSIILATFARAQYVPQFAATANAVFRMLRVKTLESTVMTVTYVAGWLINLTLVAYIFPWGAPYWDWVATTLHSSAMQAGVIAAALSAIVLISRALIGREPGLMEKEAID